MTLLEFATTWVPALELFVSVLALGSLLLVWWQIRQATTWNRLQTHHNLLSYLSGAELEEEVFRIIAQVGVDDQRRISRDACTRILETPTWFVPVKTFLNKFEHLCSAINVGAVDERYAFSVHAARVVQVFTTFESFIDVAREHRGIDEIYIELQRVAVKWLEKMAEAKIAREEEIRNLEERQRESGGVSRRI